MAIPRDTVLEKILMDPHLLQTLQTRANDYGEVCLEDTLEKVRFATEIARSFGFDVTVTMAIQIIRDLSRPCYGDVGEAFLQKTDPAHTRAVYGKRLAQKLLSGADSDRIDAICGGVERVLLGRDSTAEEWIVLTCEYFYTFALSLKDNSLRALFVHRCRDTIIKNTAKSGKLTRYPIPPNDLTRRDPVLHSDEEKQRRMSVLEEKYARCLADPQQIPEDFRRGWGDLDEKIIAAYYVAGRPEDTPLKKVL